MIARSSIFTVTISVAAEDKGVPSSSFKLRGPQGQHRVQLILPNSHPTRGGHSRLRQSPKTAALAVPRIQHPVATSTGLPDNSGAPRVQFTLPDPRCRHPQHRSISDRPTPDRPNYSLLTGYGHIVSASNSGRSSVASVLRSLRGEYQRLQLCRIPLH